MWQYYTLAINALTLIDSRFRVRGRETEYYQIDDLFDTL